MTKSSKNSTEQQIQEAMLNGGLIYVANCRVYIDNPENYDLVEAPTGFWIKNALGWNTYFKCPTRQKAQEACDKLYGGSYKVNSKV